MIGLGHVGGFPSSIDHTCNEATIANGTRQSTRNHSHPIHPFTDRLLADPFTDQKDRSGGKTKSEGIVIWARSGSSLDVRDNVSSIKTSAMSVSVADPPQPAVLLTTFWLHPPSLEGKGGVNTCMVPQVWQIEM